MANKKQAAALLMGPLLHLLHERGVDGEAILRRHGLDPMMVRDPEARLDAAVSTALLDDSLAALGDPAMAIDAARHAQYNTFGALGLAVAAGGDLHSVLNRITRFHRLISDLVSTELTVDDRTVALHFASSTDHQPHPQAIAFVMASIVRLLRIRIDRDHNPVAVAAPAWMDPALRSALARYCRCPVTESDSYSLAFDKANAQQMLAASDTQLAAMLDATLSQRLAESEHGSLASRLTLWIEQRLPDGEPAQADAAAALCLSTRSLQRRLADEGLSWKKLLEETRKMLVERHLRTPGMTVTQMAFLLGFSDVSAFSRAFKKWYGVSPSQF
ncbi:AraC family transcriptional regulator [Alcanivorax hongdengensis A-11-3]|uniref:AraC family transcriptional regulator n=1 Tax=Alcanivorax hongdengensis A-11-3 TaxID=1177179 RepID=L0WBB5_9GAMM|nr:AraC family transcriptional regulator [Alcanivorax hongdengensis]EKF74294.1 AraC family transcriptional regulator [Alcanivorax hongdengensis A-11-3]